jgi:hypothetical protein
MLQVAPSSTERLLIGVSWRGPEHFLTLRAQGGLVDVRAGARGAEPPQRVAFTRPARGDFFGRSSEVPLCSAVALCRLRRDAMPRDPSGRGLKMRPIEAPRTRP